jgi:hypothetical protein
VRKIDGYYTKTKRFVAVLGPHVATAINDYSRMFSLKYRAKWKWSLTYYDMLEAIEEMLTLDIPVILSIGPNTPKLWGKKGIPFYQQYTVEIPKDATARANKMDRKVRVLTMDKADPVLIPIEKTAEEGYQIKVETDSENESKAMTGAESEIESVDKRKAEPGNEPVEKQKAEPGNEPVEKQKAELGNETETVFRYKPVKQDINSHYITVTGIRKDPVTATIMLRISSWGSEYYINYEEYRDYVNDFSGTMTSSIVYITRKV